VASELLRFETASFYIRQGAISIRGVLKSCTGFRYLYWDTPLAGSIFQALNGGPSRASAVEIAHIVH
jgi:hypothetical protein